MASDFGSDAKVFLSENKILVNGETENRRGKKLYKNYTVEINRTISELASKKVSILVMNIILIV